MPYMVMILGSVMMTIKDMIDNVFSHNSLIKIWGSFEVDKNHSYMLWKGVAWETPKEFLNLEAMIFGSIVESIWESDYLNLEVKNG